ncbi:MAG: hypothetical protein ACFCVF_15565 [Kineosporiaceae bacterium]
MIILGIALAVASLVVVTFVGIGGSTGDEATVTVRAFGIDVTTSALVVFLTGALAMLILLGGLWMIRWGAVRAARTRAEIQRLRRIEAEVEARQVAELSASSPRRADGRPGDESEGAPVVPVSPAGGRTADRAGEHDEDAPVVDETRVMRPFQREEDLGGGRHTPDAAGPGAAGAGSPGLDPGASGPAAADRKTTGDADRA